MILQTTFTNLRIDLEHPTTDMIRLTDIAQGLSRCCRFAGQVSGFYSVAQHALLVASLVDRPLALLALHHDDTEAYMGDLSRNLKHHPLLHGYRMLEANLHRVIQARFGIECSPEQWAHVKVADDLAAIYEYFMVLQECEDFDPVSMIQWAIQQGFVQRTAEELMLLVLRLPRELVPAKPDEARRLFVDAHRKLS